MADSKPLRLMALPYIAYKLVLPDLEPIQVIDTCLKSKKFKNMVTAVKIKANSLKWTFDKDNCNIFIVFDNCRYYLKLSTPYRTPLMSAREIKGAELRMEPTNNNSNAYIREYVSNGRLIYKTSKMNLMEVYTQWILGIMKIQNFELQTNLSETIDFLNCFVWNVTQKFSKLEFHCQEDQPSEKCIENLQYLQTRITVDTMNVEFYKMSKRGPSNQICIPLKHRIMKVVMAEFLAPESLLTMECAHLDLFWPRIGCSDLNKILMTWMSGGLNNLERMCVRAEFGSNFKSGVETLRGITTTMPRWPRISMNYIGFTVAGDVFARSIQRENDDKTATVVFNSNRFRLFVWSEPVFEHFHADFR